LGDPPLERGLTPRELRRLREEDPDAYAKVLKEINEAFAPIARTFRGMADAMSDPPQLRAPWGLHSPYDQPEPGVEPTVKRSTLPKLKNKSLLAYYTHGELAKAARGIELKSWTNGDVTRQAGLPGPDARRIRLMLAVPLMWLNDDGALIVPAHVRLPRKGSKYALRYLSEDGGAWLDPNEELGGQ
jgi:hypothetical protein